MKRREFVQTVGVISASGLLVACDPKAETPSPIAGAQAANAEAASTEAKVTPDWASNLKDSDMVGRLNWRTKHHGHPSGANGA
jgi:hypothetical protein